MNKEQVMTILSKNSDNLRAFNVKALYLFGSVVRSDEGQMSDVDILVEFEPDARIGLFEFSRLQRMLSGLLGCEVDLSPPRSPAQGIERANHAGGGACRLGIGCFESTISWRPSHQSERKELIALIESGALLPAKRWYRLRYL